MKTNSKATKAKTNNWVLQHKETGKVFSNWTYPSRTAARKAAKGRKFKGMYKPAKSGGGGIDPKKLKKGKPAPTPKAVLTEDQFFASIDDLFVLTDAAKKTLDALYDAHVTSLYSEFDAAGAFETTVVPEVQADLFNSTQEESNTVMRKNVNTKPKLRNRSSAPGSKFHRHGTFGVK